MSAVDDAGLLRRRKRLLYAFAPVFAITVVMAVKLLSLPLAAGQASSAFAGGDADKTLQAGQLMGTLNLVERYKAHFAVGDGFVLQGDFEQARTEFATALTLAPPAESCRVRVNLVLSVEKLGMQQAEGGDPASARELFAEGSKLIEEAPQDCFAAQSPNNGQGEGDALEQAGERLAQKQKGAPNADPEQAGAEQGEEAAPVPADKLEQLEKSAQEAQKERSQGQKLKDALDSQEPEQYAKPW